ncbi:DUF3558 domain-containing protein [Streptomyces sp. NBC_00083]|uniref:DUF3558 domain-containing protein n=1 Tax=Streptomyces sp. NBC_00083 TaxID=2975647 RepID=UPI00225804BE|nr:DUF3558 domain-containing protein [Streptomyces sp. NBC_00083]MCX5384897.1 DUF3558 domain-containing protein [Streptomyces sp. NBC_00083]
MQRKAYVPGLALLVALASGCSAASGSDGSSTDSKGGVTKSAPAPAGKYRTLPEPCHAVSRSALKDMLPGAAGLADADATKEYAGSADLTYDTDRRVGCRWKDETADGVRRLTVDFERVVSYDPTVSDDDQTQELYAKKEAAANLPAPRSSAPAASPTPSGSPASPASPASKAAGGSGSPVLAPGRAVSPSGTASPGGTPSAGGSGTPGGTDPDGLQPRRLSGLGDAAFIDDVASPAGTGGGAGAGQRTVTVVFRTSNVIVTIEYTAQAMASAEVPDSKELQEQAQAMAGKLVEQFNE